jgi:DNA polymerase III subunit epsilon
VSQYDHQPPHPTQCDHSGAVRWIDLPVLAVDTETTRADSETCSIVELGACWAKGGLSSLDGAERLGTLIDPGITIPAESTEIHGIRDQDVIGKPALGDIVPDFMARVSQAGLIVGYNVRGFDGPILGRLIGPDWARAMQDRPMLDALDVVRLNTVGRFWRGQGRHKLTSVAERLGLEWVSNGAHRASADAQMSLQVLRRFANRLPECARCANEWLALASRQERVRFEAYIEKQKAKEEEAA